MGNVELSQSATLTSEKPLISKKSAFLEKPLPSESSFLTETIIGEEHSNYWSFEAIEERIKLKKEKRLLTL